MRARRVVTGHDPAGTAVVVSDGPAPRSHEYRHIPGLVEALVWATDGPVETGRADRPRQSDPTATASSYVPRPGGTRLIWLQIPPDAVFQGATLDGEAARQEQLIASPGLAERFEPDSPGMHATPTTDYAIVVSGTLWLELDGGVETRLDPGDVVIQRSTRHAWRNHGDTPAVLVVVLVGNGASAS